MTRQVKHIRRSKRGKPFVAGSRKKVKALPAPKGNWLFRVNNMDVFRKVIRAYSGMISEAKLKFSAEGLATRSMDPANVMMMDLMLKSGAKHIIQTAPGKLDIGLNMVDFAIILRNRDKKDTMLVSKPANNLLFKAGDTEMELPIIDLEEKEQKLPELKPVFDISISSKEFMTALSDADKVAESIVFMSKPGAISWSAEGDMSKARGILRGKASGQNDEKVKYSIEYLKKLGPALQIVPEVRLKFSKDYPLTVEIMTESLSLTAILAPRVDND